MGSAARVSPVEPRMKTPPSNKGNVHFETGLATRTSSGLIWIGPGNVIMAGDTCQFFAVKTPKGNDFLGAPADLPVILRPIGGAPCANAAHYEALC
jgi:hypothetical protein